MAFIAQWWRPVLAVVGLVLAALFFLLFHQAISITEKPSWPPGRDARCRS